MRTPFILSVLNTTLEPVFDVEILRANNYSNSRDDFKDGKLVKNEIEICSFTIDSTYEDVIDYFIKNKIFVRLIYVQYEELPASANVSLSSKDVYGNEAKITNGIDIYAQDRKTIVFKREMLIDHLFAIIIHEVPAQGRCLVYIFP
jgi:hypothetical protein